MRRRSTAPNIGTHDARHAIFAAVFRRWSRDRVLALTVRVLLAVTLVLNGIADASTRVQPCHVDASQQNSPAFAHALHGSHEAVRMQGHSTDMQIAPAHGEHAHVVNGRTYSEDVQAAEAKRVCTGSCCQGTTCPSHSVTPAMVLAAAPAMPRLHVIASPVIHTAMRVRMRPHTPPDRPPAR